jgi:hypothetical protein
MKGQMWLGGRKTLLGSVKLQSCVTRGLTAVKFHLAIGVLDCDVYFLA